MGSLQPRKYVQTTKKPQRIARVDMRLERICQGPY